MPLEQVDELVPGVATDDVGVTHPGDLRADGHAAVDRGDAHPMRHAPSGTRTSATCCASSRVGTRTSPRGVFLRRGPGVAASRVSSGRPKASVLPGPGLGAAQHVAALPARRAAPGPDRERLVDVTRRERPDQPRVQAELGERGRGRRRSRGGGVQGTIQLGVRCDLRWPGVQVPGPRAGLRRAGRRARTPGQYAACGKLHHCSGAACSDRRQQPRRPAGGFRPRSGVGEDRRLTAQGYQPGWYSPSFRPRRG